MGLLSKKRQGPSPEVVERVKEIAREPVRNGFSKVEDLQMDTPNMEYFAIKTDEEEKWEQRRWELVRHLVAQDRRSVVLGKLRCSDKAIARRARLLADATINELRNNNADDYGQE